MDDFSSQVLGWPVAEDNSASPFYENGSYTIQQKQKVEYRLVFLPVAFNPTEILFDAWSPEGDQFGTFGSYCQYQDPQNSYYV